MGEGVRNRGALFYGSLFGRDWDPPSPSLQALWGAQGVQGSKVCVMLGLGAEFVWVGLS